MPINEEEMIHWHNEPGRHRFGEALFLPSRINGITTGTPFVGVSDAPAREDHVHGFAAEAWTDYTPQVDQTSTNISKTIENAFYMKQGSFCHVILGLVFTAGGGGAAEITVTLPVMPSTQYATIGNFWYWDQTTPGVIYSGLVPEVVSTSVQKMRFKHGAGTGTGYFGTAPSLNIGSSDILRGGLSYRVVA